MVVGKTSSEMMGLNYQQDEVKQRVRQLLEYGVQQVADHIEFASDILRKFGLAVGNELKAIMSKDDGLGNFNNLWASFVEIPGTPAQTQKVLTVLDHDDTERLFFIFKASARHELMLS